MEDYEKELLADFDSDSDSDDKNEVEQEQTQDELQQADYQSNQSPSQEQEQITSYTINDVLQKSSNFTVQEKLNQYNVDDIDDISKISIIKPIIPELKRSLELYSNNDSSDYFELLTSLNDNVENDEYKFILQINEISNLINHEIIQIHTFIKIHYSNVFPELESLILNPIDYCKIIILIKQDLSNIKNYEQDLKLITTNEKVLVIIMSALQYSQNQTSLKESQFDRILEACFLINELNDVLIDLSKFISNKLSKFAPNVSAIIGPITTSQLLIATGSLRSLSLTPSCNIPSLGVKDLSSQTKTKSNAIRATGYLYHCDLISFLPTEIMKSVMRIISGKIVLAARIDLSNSSPLGEIGEKYLTEIHNKIEKLLTPPKSQIDKALPVPIDQKSKKRGGRRFRKMKERFQMSELRKAQNKMEFGKQEDYIMDEFGEEVGLGMSKSGTGGRLKIQANNNTSAKMSKSMINRLQQQKQQSINGQLDSFTLSNPNAIDEIPKKNPKLIQPSNKNSNKDLVENKWFSGMKRKVPITNDSDNNDGTNNDGTNKKIKF